MTKVRILTSTKRVGPLSVAVTFKMPIARAVRNAVDEEIEQIRNCVIPIVGADARKKTCVMGSAVAIIYRGDPFLVTAHHVLEDHQDAGLAFFAFDGSSRPFAGTFSIDESHDLAVKKINSSEIQALSHIPFLTEERIGPVVPPGSSFYATVTGFPSTAARRFERNTIDTRMEAFSNFAVEGATGEVEVLFDKKEGVHGSLGFGQARDQYGKSGGAIFGLALGDGFRLPTLPAKLAGIATRWRRDKKAISGASARQLLNLLEAMAG